jgi:hypothetical protein
MPHLAPIVIPSGQSVVGQSLQFHAYSLRVDNLTNQWLQEESSLAWIPPYSLGTCLRLYGTAVAIILNRAPTGQPQLAPIVGEYTSGFFSDEYRTEVAGAPVRQFTLVQAVSDLTQGPQPALPPVGVDRLYADSSGNIHHLHSNGTDLTLVDPSNAGTLLYPTFDPHYQALVNATALGGELHGTVSNAVINNGAITSAKINPNVLDLRPQAFYASDHHADRGDGTGAYFAGSSGTHFLYWNASVWTLSDPLNVTGTIIAQGGDVRARSGNVYFGANDQSLLQMWNPGELRLSSSPGNLYLLGALGCTVINASAAVNCVNLVLNYSGYAIQNPGTNDSIYWDRSTLLQFSSTGTQFQFYSPTHGWYWNFTLTSNNRIQMGGTHYTFSNCGGVECASTGAWMQWPNGSYISGNAGYVQGSRRALKQSIATLSDSDLLARVADARLPVSSYIWPDDERRNIGFIADDIALVLPEAVVRDDNGEPSGYNAQELTAMLWGAVRALNGRVDQLVNAA